MLVDDAHWLDGSSADALLFAFRRLIADPVAVILAVREGESSLLDGADLPTLRLAGPGPGRSGRAAGWPAGRAAPPELADRLHRETGGNPLALLELGEDRELADDSPPGTPLAVGTSVASVYLLRFRSLPPSARDVLVLAAASRQRRACRCSPSAASPLGLDVADLIPAEAAALIDRARCPCRVPAPARPVGHLR